MRAENIVRLSFAANKELPIVENSHQPPYSRKNNNNPKINKSPLERKSVKAQYMKMCHNVKKSFSNSSNKQSNSTMRRNRNILKREGTVKEFPFSFTRAISQKKNQISQMECVGDCNLLVNALDKLELHNLKKKKIDSPEFTPIFKGKKLKPLANFIIKRLETDYLNIEKAKIHEVQKLQVKQAIEYQNQCHFRNHSSLSYRTQKNFEYCPPSKEQERATDNNSSNSPVPASSKQFKTQMKTKNNKPFTPPFTTYYYRDLLWKVSFSNTLLVPTQLQYEHRLRVYIGKGNNGGLIRGLIKRRIWFAITDRIEDANFVWTQLKQIPFIQILKKTDLQPSVQNDEIRGKGLFTEKQKIMLSKYFATNMKIQERQDQKLTNRKNWFQTKTSSSTSLEQSVKFKTVKQIRQQKLHNHFINNYMIGNKKTLFQTMSSYYKSIDDFVFNYLPYTYHVKEGLNDDNFVRFLRFYNEKANQIKNQAIRKKDKGKEDKNQENLWIVKPGENSNQGAGIRVCKTLDDVKKIVRSTQKNLDGTDRSYIVQMYIEKPLLYNKRKFDLRHYMMITSVNGVLKGYWYRQGYVRTTSSEYSNATKQSKVHLTNDSIQKQMADYGKYEKGNKLSYDELHNYLSRLYGYKNFLFKDIILPKMKKIGTDIIKASSGVLDPDQHANTFQIFGLDFMIDSDFNLWLIEVNTNPCLEISCPLLGTIIPKMIENALELTLDPLFPPPIRYCPKGVHYFKKLEQQNKFDLVYDSRVDGIYKGSSNVLDQKLQNQQDDTFDEEGEEWNEDD